MRKQKPERTSRSGSFKKVKKFGKGTVSAVCGNPACNVTAQVPQGQDYTCPTEWCRKGRDKIKNAEAAARFEAAKEKAKKRSGRA